jgi:superfamily II DNA or RNA helicase
MRIGAEPKAFKRDSTGALVAFSSGKRRLFSIRGSSEGAKKRVSTLFSSRRPEPSEKISALPVDELILLKQGTPSEQVQYALSLWTELAEWLFSLQKEGRQVTLTFSKEKGKLPGEIVIKFAQVEVRFAIAEGDWPEVIPALETVDSPLPVNGTQTDLIDSLRYNPEKREIEVTFSKGKIEEQSRPEGIRVGEWIYVESDGFYPAESDALLEQPVIPAGKIPLFFQKYPKLAERVGLHAGTYTPTYSLSFDEKKNLHLVCSLAGVGDLSASFGAWVYADGKGFYKLESPLFEGTKKVIPFRDVADFVSHHRTWLHDYPGFQTHVAALEFDLSYSVSKEGVLRFESTLGDDEEEREELVDFGEWIYVAERGFYPKNAYRGGIRAGVVVDRNQVPAFIRSHRQELEAVKGFFNSFSPVEKVGLSISLTETERIKISPKYFFKKGYKPQVFADFVYLEEEGFSEIPAALKLPEQFSGEREIDAASEPFFLACELDTLLPFVTTIDKRLIRPTALKLCVEQIKPAQQKGAWFVQMEYRSEIGSLEIFDIWRAQNEKKRNLFSSAGLIFLKDPRFSWLKGLSKKRFSKKGRVVRLTTLEWMRLSIFEEVKEPEDEGARHLLLDLREMKPPELPDLTGLESLLRPYQEMGVRWLFFLYTYGLSGFLCDEMGLGKTHQAMGLIAAVHNTQPGKYLVVCPTSVIYHWQDLLKRFLPHIRVSVFYGLERTIEKFEADYDLLLTSYGTLRSEKLPLSKLPFNLAVFDETHIAKNAHSQTNKALRLINAQMRLALTGTPIENRLLELKALFDLILPGYLPQESLFREFFVYPIEKNEDPQRKALLARLIRPFLLRRKKSEVLQQLPEKTEMIAYVDLSPEQRQLYKETYETHRAALVQKMRNDSEPVPLAHIFSLLSSLKQICDHPCLATGNIEEFRKHKSGKWDLFVELLAEARASNQKMVVFSQYLGMLDIMAAYLKEEGIGFATIRGSTRDRKEQMERFRDDPTCEVFLGSLQAAGVGIELVAASIVIHYDRWWNPAKENQATDRVHRIGQSRGVQVFKMVCKNTVEEHIHRLIEKKLGLLEGVVGFDDQDQIKGLSRDELLHILELLELQGKSEEK